MEYGEAKKNLRDDEQKDVLPSGFVTYPKHMEKSPSGQAVAAEPRLIKKGF